MQINLKTQSEFSKIFLFVILKSSQETNLQDGKVEERTDICEFIYNDLYYQLHVLMKQ